MKTEPQTIAILDDDGRAIGRPDRRRADRDLDLDGRVRHLREAIEAGRAGESWRLARELYRFVAVERQFRVTFRHDCESATMRHEVFRRAPSAQQAVERARMHLGPIDIVGVEDLGW